MGGTRALHWSAAFALLASALIPTTAIDAMGLTLPEIRKFFLEVRHVDTLISLVGSSAAFSFAVSAPFVGRVIDRIGCRAVYIASLAMFGIVGVAGCFVADLKLLIVTRAIVGLAVAGALTAGLTGISYLDPSSRGRMLGFHALVGSLGAVALFGLVGQLVEFGWQAAFSIHVLGFALIPLALTLPQHLENVRIDVSGAQVSGIQSGPLLAGVDAKLLLTTALVGMVMFSVPMLTPFYLISIGITQPSAFALPLLRNSLMPVGRFT